MMSHEINNIVEPKIILNEKYKLFYRGGKERKSATK